MMYCLFWCLVRFHFDGLGLFGLHPLDHFSLHCSLLLHHPCALPTPSLQEPSHPSVFPASRSARSTRERSCHSRSRTCRRAGSCSRSREPRPDRIAGRNAGHQFGSRSQGPWTWPFPPSFAAPRETQAALRSCWSSPPLTPSFSSSLG